MKIPLNASRRRALAAVGGFGALALLSKCGAPVDDTDDTVTDGGTITTLAIGSGSFLTDKSYANPFASGAGTSCVAYKSATAGPCHSNTYDRKDVSDGLVGLPTRTELLILDTACKPVANAVVEIWYASPAGTYSSAQTATYAGSYKGSYSVLNVGFCTGNATEALASNWLRGFQTTNSEGRVTFDGIYPGWYASRTTHIHFKITVGTQQYVTSQLFVDDTLSAKIYGTHGSYASRGQKDTTNAGDKVISESGLTLSNVVLSYEVQNDGAMLMWKAITIT